MTNNSFYNDVITGLSKENKQLNSKYFYDATGDALFQKIMQLPEYYLTKCELEILSDKKEEIITSFIKPDTAFDVVELGVGDASKSICILESLQKKQTNWQYFPIDISPDILKEVEQKISNKIPDIQIKGLAGEYFDMMEQVKGYSNKNKIVFFLGSTIGNFEKKEAATFLKKLKSYLLPGDFLLIGFDLVKDPEIILKAYNDNEGVTKSFNLNLLQRINKELGGDFNLKDFSHYPMFHNNSGACESHLISLKAQEVKIGEHIFTFKENETIFMEISQKYNIDEVDEMAEACGFLKVENFTDKKKWFLDTVWEVK